MMQYWRHQTNSLFQERKKKNIFTALRKSDLLIYPFELFTFNLKPFEQSFALYQYIT